MCKEPQNKGSIVQSSSVNDVAMLLRRVRPGHLAAYGSEPDHDFISCRRGASRLAWVSVEEDIYGNVGLGIQDR